MKVSPIPPNPFAKQASLVPRTYIDLFAVSTEESKRSPTPMTNAGTPGPPGDSGGGATQILPFLWLGGIEAAQDSEFHRRAGVKLVINLSQTSYWIADPTITMVKVDVGDRADSDILAAVKKLLPLLTRAKEKWASSLSAEPAALQATRSSRPNDVASVATDVPPSVLVHCQKGISRSSTVVAAFLIFANGWSVAEALDFIWSKRPQVQPNMGFVNQLHVFYDALTENQFCKRYDRPALRRKLCLLLRNVGSASEEHIKKAFAPYGEVYQVERFEGGSLSAVFFTTQQARHWAERAFAASPELRRALSLDSEAPAQSVRMPSRALTRRHS